MGITALGLIMMAHSIDSVDHDSRPLFMAVSVLYSSWASARFPFFFKSHFWTFMSHNEAVD